MEHGTELVAAASWDRVPDDVRLGIVGRLATMRDDAEELVWFTAFLIQHSGTSVDDLCRVLSCSPATFYNKTKPYREALAQKD